MGDRYLTDLADVCRGAGLAVLEVAGWQGRARGSGGYDGDRPWCVMWHHTASNTTPDNDVNYIVYGSPDAPLANLYLARDGTVWVCAGGATNTNGKGDAKPFTRGTCPADQMNTHAIGVEMANTGTGETWPAGQIDAMFRLSLALCAAYGLAADDVMTHQGYAPDRKIDPATADAVAGDWTPDAVTSSGTWSLDDIRAELLLRTTNGDDDDMNAATLWRPQGYLNVFLIGAGSTVTVSPAVLDSLTARGVPLIVEQHVQMLETCLFQTGLTQADLIPGGG